MMVLQRAEAAPFASSGHCGATRQQPTRVISPPSKAGSRHVRVRLASRVARCEGNEAHQLPEMPMMTTHGDHAFPVRPGSLGMLLRQMVRRLQRWRHDRAIIGFASFHKPVETLYIGHGVSHMVGRFVGQLPSTAVRVRDLSPELAASARLFQPELDIHLFSPREALPRADRVIAINAMTEDGRSGVDLDALLSMTRQRLVVAQRPPIAAGSRGWCGQLRRKARARSFDVRVKHVSPWTIVSFEVYGHGRRRRGAPDKGIVK